MTADRPVTAADLKNAIGRGAAAVAEHDHVRAAKATVVAARNAVFEELKASTVTALGPRFRLALADGPNVRIAEGEYRKTTAVQLETVEGQGMFGSLIHVREDDAVETIRRAFVRAMASAHTAAFVEMWKEPPCASCGRQKAGHDFVKCPCYRYTPMATPIASPHALAGHIPGARACRIERCHHLDPVHSRDCLEKSCRGTLHVIGVDDSDYSYGHAGGPMLYAWRCDTCGHERRESQGPFW
ncbi:MAG: hypothetical protein ACHREM_00530 [Polyangiales bacterium]